MHDDYTDERTDGATRDETERRLSRRGFLRLASLAGAGALLAGLAACGGEEDDDEDEDDD